MELFEVLVEKMRPVFEEADEELREAMRACLALTVVIASVDAPHSQRLLGVLLDICDELALAENFESN